MKTPEKKPYRTAIAISPPRFVTGRMQNVKTPQIIAAMPKTIGLLETLVRIWKRHGEESYG